MSTEKNEGLRQRKANGEQSTTTTPEASTKAPATTVSASSIILDVLRALVGLVVVGALASYLITSGESWTFRLLRHPSRPWWLDINAWKLQMKGALLLTPAQLATYDGSTPGTPIYVALNRTIYDVTASAAVYGPGGPYSKLAAKDASRSYITTCFDPDQDLVPWLNGTEEVFVPLWLSKKPRPSELKKMLEGDTGMGLNMLLGPDSKGQTAEELIDGLRKKMGRKASRLAQEEAYREAWKMVEAQVRQWEGMFKSKNYPAVGRVVGLDETDDSQWRSLGFCEAALAQRPSMAESLAKIVERKGRGNMNLAQMKGSNANAAKDKEDRRKLREEARRRAKGKPVDEPAEGAEQEQKAPERDEKAYAKINDMIYGGKFADAE